MSSSTRRPTGRLAGRLLLGALALTVPAPAMVPSPAQAADVIDVAPGQPDPTGLPLPVVRPIGSLQSRSVLVLRVRFAGAPEPSAGELSSFDPSAIRSVLTGTANASAGSLLSQQSGGSVSLTGRIDPRGDVSPWVTLPGQVPTTGSDCDALQIARDALAAGAGLLPSLYDHVVVAFPRTASCTFAVQATRPGRTVWLNGLRNAESAGLGADVRAALHGLGHNLGAADARALRCTDGDLAVGLSATCSPSSGAGDPFDAMGASAPWDGSTLMSMARRIALGHAPTASSQTITAAGLYTLRAAGSSGAQLLRIVRPGVDQRLGELTLEYRPGATAYDRWQLGDAQASRGVLVRVGDPQDPLGTTYLLDGTPETTRRSDPYANLIDEGFSDAALEPGRTFEDRQTGVRIKTIAVAGDAATVAISGGPLMASDQPPRPVGDVTTVQEGFSVWIGWHEAEDDLAVDRYELRRDGTLVATVAAGAETGFRDRPAWLAPSATYQLDAVDLGGNRVTLAKRTIPLSWGSGTAWAPPVAPPPATPQRSIVPTPQPTATPAPGVEERALVTGRPQVMRPRVRRGRGRLDRTRLLSIRVAGAEKMYARIGRKRLKTGLSEQATWRLPRSAVRRSTIVVTARGAALRRQVRLRISVRRSKLRVSVLER